VSFIGTLNAKQTAATFQLVIGSGLVQASLVFSKWPSLTLTVRAADGSIVGSASGGSVLPLVKSSRAGSYLFSVTGTGEGGSSFTLTVNYAPTT
jgi:hypothetical protein